MAAWKGDFLSLGFNYNIVSILGPQSGGKSTLLNLMFHTNFVVMDDTHRKQTTKGMLYKDYSVCSKVLTDEYYTRLHFCTWCH